jgi:hypothetical protein
MPAADRKAREPVSLDRRIREVEVRLAGRQAAIGSRSAALGRNVRESLGSPIALLAAAGAGFAIGQFSKRKRAEPHADSAPASTRPSILATALDALTLATTVMALLPAMRRAPARDPERTGEMP